VCFLTTSMQEPISIRLEHGDPLSTHADALAVQYPQQLYGLVERVVNILAAAERAVLLPKNDAVRLLEAVAGITAPHILVVGVTPVRTYDYRDLYGFAHRAITHLASIPRVRHIVLPAYGPRGYRLDDAKSFEVEVEGIIDAVRATAVRDAIGTVTLVESDKARAERLWRLLSGGLIKTLLDKSREELDAATVSFYSMRALVGDR
jgi:hypothetical protein